MNTCPASDLRYRYLHQQRLPSRRCPASLLIVKNGLIYMSLNQHILYGWMDELGFKVPFNSILVISRRWMGKHERLCAMKRRLGSGRISSPATP